MFVVDWDRINELRGDIGEEDFADLAILFVSELHETITRLVTQPDSVTEADFHFLRGGASNLGFQSVVDACTSAEEACLNGQSPNIEAVHAAFEAAMVEITVQFPQLSIAV